MLSKLIGLVLLVVSTSAFAQRTIQLDDPVYLNDCRGLVTLNKAFNGDLSIQLRGLDTDRCDTLRVTDASSGRVIREYTIQGTSYTLSQDMLFSLSDDCRLNFSVSGGFWRSDSFTVYIPWCSSRSYPRYPSPSYPRTGYVTYEWSNNGNCKKMIDGVFSGELVSDYYCPGRRPRHDNGRGGYGRVTYEWSNKHNCKKMVDGVFSGDLVPDYYCR